MNWKYRPLGAAASFSFYDQWVGMVKAYRDSGRHTIEQGSGRCDLVITNVSTNDAGTYECCDDYGDGDNVELVVLGEILPQSEYFNCIIGYTCFFFVHTF